MATAAIRALPPDQLESVTFDPTTEERIAEILTHYPTRRAAILPILWLCQDRYGWIAPGVMRAVADRLGESPAFVEGVVTFYTMFYTSRPASFVLQVCVTLSCHVCGAGKLLAFLEDRLGIGPGEKTPDGLFQIVGVQCLGACGGAPVIQINDDYYESLNEERLGALLDELASGA